MQKPSKDEEVSPLNRVYEQTLVTRGGLSEVCIPFCQSYCAISGSCNVRHISRLRDARMANYRSPPIFKIEKFDKFCPHDPKFNFSILPHLQRVHFVQSILKGLERLT